MAEYDFERLNILVAEDSSFLSSLMLTALHELGVANIKTVTDGGEAIEVLKLTKSNPSMAGILNIDLVVSNWQMTPIDGLMRDTRRIAHPDAPPSPPGRVLFKYWPTL